MRSWMFTQCKYGRAHCLTGKMMGWDVQNFTPGHSLPAETKSSVVVVMVIHIDVQNTLGDML